MLLLVNHKYAGTDEHNTRTEDESFSNVLTRKSGEDHQVERIKEEKTNARGTGRHATARALPTCSNGK
jgi:hypothetical protein